MPTPANPGEEQARHYPLLAAAFVVAAQVVIRNAWLSDDAYITCRTIDNFLHGWGLRWNVSERVQSYTHPLWMLLNLAAIRCTGEYFYTLFATSLACSLAAILLLLRNVSRSATALAFSLLAIVMSKSFVEYSTSGLENPLSHLLLIVQLLLCGPGPCSPRRFAGACLTACLVVLNRMDLAVLAGPPLLVLFLANRSWRFLGIALLAGIPLLAWEAFSILYYGFPFPNTAYAKIANGFPAGMLAYQSLFYYLNSLELDPVTLCVIATAILVAAWRRTPQNLAMASGIALYLVYIVRIGGDFMSGRFFAAPYLVAVFLLSRHVASAHPSWLPAAAVVALGLCAPVPPPLANTKNADWKHDFQNGIADERAVHFPTQGLLTALRTKEMPANSTVDWALEKHEAGPIVWNHPGVGLFGLHVGPEVYVVDYYALCDPLLARLPAGYVGDWRPGHLTRAVPWGYWDTLETGRNMLQDKNLAAYYDHLKIVLSGPLLDRNRLKEIWRFNTHQHDHYIADYLKNDERWKVDSKVVTFKAADLDSPFVGKFEPWREKNHRFGRMGAEIDMGGLQRAPVLMLTVSNASAYKLAFLRNGVPVDSVRIIPRPLPGYVTHRVTVPPKVLGGGGYDRLFLKPYNGDLEGYVNRVAPVTEGMGPAFGRPWKLPPGGS